MGKRNGYRTHEEPDNEPETFPISVPLDPRLPIVSFFYVRNDECRNRSFDKCQTPFEGHDSSREHGRGNTDYHLSHLGGSL